MDITIVLYIHSFLLHDSSKEGYGFVSLFTKKLNYLIERFNLKVINIIIRLLLSLYIIISTISNDNNNTKYILLVDDYRDTLFTFDIYLKSIVGYTTVSFNDPVEALGYFNKNVDNCIMVITDYGIPQMSGLDLIEKIREKDRNYKIKIILISATVKNDIINSNDKFLKLKVDKFLEKPVHLDKFKNEIKMLIN
jgi:CheY-like chemotaxis protein